MGASSMNGFTSAYVDHSIPHEAGHIVVGKCFGWIRIRELAVHIVRDRDGIAVGDFATASIEPSDAAIAMTPPERMAEYKLFVAGGLAGNRFAGVPAAEVSLQDDRAKLARVGPESLEEMAEKAERIIHERSSTFSRLQSLIQQRFENLAIGGSDSLGRQTLLSPEDLRIIFAEG
jgi:hypothetical protein